MSRITLKKINNLKKDKIGITAITAYDASFAKYFDNLNFDIILVGDSLGEVIKGDKNTHNVTIDEIIYHSSIVKKASKKSYIISDLPKESFKNKKVALRHSLSILSKCKVDMIKIECNLKNLSLVDYLISNKVPICCHLGLTPQHIRRKSSYRKYGRTEIEFNTIYKLAIEVEKLGAKMLLLECVIDELANKISKNLLIPVIGIGSGSRCDGQIIVSYDILGLSYNQTPNNISKKYFKIKDLNSRIKKYISDTKKFSNS